TRSRDDSFVAQPPHRRRRRRVETDRSVTEARVQRLPRVPGPGRRPTKGHGSGGEGTASSPTGGLTPRSGVQRGGPARKVGDQSFRAGVGNVSITMTRAATATSKAGAPVENQWAPKPPESAAPMAPATLEETGLTSAFIADLTLKLLYQKGQSTAQELSDAMCLPLAQVCAPVFDFLKNEHLVEVKGGSGVAAATYVYVLATKGTERAREALARNGYVGPAPVTLPAYIGRVRAQTLGDMQISME